MNLVNNKYVTYVLFSQIHNRFYIGQTSDLEKRLERHLTGKVNSTKPYCPFRLIYTEEFQTRSEAMKREKELKLTSGRRFLKNLINSHNSEEPQSRLP